MSTRPMYIDHFLEGSYTYYNYRPSEPKPYCLYAQIAGFQRIGQKYYNEVEGQHTYMLNFTTKGEGIYISEAGEKTIHKGDLIITHNYFHHILKPVPQKEWEFYFVHIFENALIGACYQAIARHHGSVISNAPEDKIVPLIKEIAECIKTKSHDSDFLCSQKIYELFLAATQASEANSSKPYNPALDQAIGFIQSHHNEEISPRDVVAQSNYSKNHLERIFKEHTGMNIRTYMTYLRLERAKNLLLTTSLSLKEIAAHTGFKEYRSLYNLFIKTYGASPGEYRMNPGRYENKQW